LIKGSKDSYFSLESKNTASQNIGAWIGWWRHQINQKTRPHHDPLGPKPPIQIKKTNFYSKLHEDTSLYRVWISL